MRPCLRSWLLCGLAATAGAQMRTVQVDAGKVIGMIRSLQGVGGAPISSPVKRYRVTRTEDWVESESRGRGGILEISNRLPAPDMELIVIRRK